VIHRGSGDPHPADPAAAGVPRLIDLGVALFLVFVTVLTFLPGLDGAFLDWDDRENFLHNPHFRGLGPAQLHWMLTTGLLGHWMPLTWLSLAVDWTIWGLNPFGYHLTSLGLHAICTVLVYLLARRLFVLTVPRVAPTTHALGATVAALLFASHPLRVESVAWITERRDVLAGVFFLGAVLAYLARWNPDGFARPRPRLRYLAVLALFAAALLSKAMSVSLPVVLLILDVYPLRRLSANPRNWLSNDARQVWLEKAPLVLLSVGVTVNAIAINSGAGNLTSMERVGLLDRIAISLYSLAFYPWKTLLPAGLSPMYELPHPLEPWRGPFVVAVLAVAGMTAASIALARRWPALAAAWAAYVVMTLPVAGLVQNGFQIAADRYTYLPCVPWALLAGGGLLALARVRPRLLIPAVALSALLITVLATLSWRQTQIWRDTETLWRHALSVAPSAVAHANLGLTLARRDQAGAAIPHYHAALAIQPRYPEAWNNLGLALVEGGDLVGAERSLREAIRVKPRFSEAWSNLGLVLARRGETAPAVAAYREALRLRPDNTDAHGNLGATLDAQGKGEEALVHLREALRLRPESAQAHGNLGTYFARRGDLGTAAGHFEEALRLRPAFAEAHNNLGLALAQQGRLDVAATHFREAVRLRPDFRDAHSNLARAQAELARR
jgi:Flp pilus assembly protein TadD